MLNRGLRSLDKIESLLLLRWGKDPLGIQIQVVRLLLASGTLLTLAFNSPRNFVGTMMNSPDAYCQGLSSWGLFCVFPEQTNIAIVIACISCFAYGLGLVPVLSGLGHLYAAFTVANNNIVVDGGDQLTFNVSVAVYLISCHRWQGFAWKEARQPSVHARFISAHVLLLAVRIQVAFVYFEAAVDKLAVQQWEDGTAMWYWMQNSGVGLYQGTGVWWLGILSSPLVSALMTWGVMALEVALFVSVLTAQRRWMRFMALGAGIAFHLGIAVVMGLSSFGLAMSAALVCSLWHARDAMPWRVFRPARLAWKARGVQADSKRSTVSGLVRS